MNLVKKISFLAASFVISVGIYGCSTMPEMTSTKERMPKVGGILVYKRSLSGSKSGRTDKIYIKSRGFRKSENQEIYAYHLNCNGKAEEKPYSVITLEKLHSGKEKAILYLDLDRDGFVDPNGKIIGRENFLSKHDLIGDAPECK